MAQAIPNPPPGFDELSAEEKLDYVQFLWDRIAAKPEAVPVPDWHLEVIDERLAENRGRPRAGRSWDELREELRAELRKRRPSAEREAPCRS
jgi:putative addiction module component (TIGR02574 family)